MYYYHFSCDIQFRSFCMYEKVVVSESRAERDLSFASQATYFGLLTLDSSFLMFDNPSRYILRLPII
jgi:hypothetical protein